VVQVVTQSSKRAIIAATGGVMLKIGEAKSATLCEIRIVAVQPNFSVSIIIATRVHVTKPARAKVIWHQAASLQTRVSDPQISPSCGGPRP